MNRNQLAAFIVACISATTAIVLPVAIVSENSTARLRACVQNGGAYVQVAERTTMECER